MRGRTGASPHAALHSDGADSGMRKITEAHAVRSVRRQLEKAPAGPVPTGVLPVLDLARSGRRPNLVIDMLATPPTKTRFSRRLRVLVVSPYFPFPPVSGARMRTYQLIRQLAERHDVTLVSYAGEGDGPGARELSGTVSVRAIHRIEETGLARRLGQARSLLSREPFASWVLRSKEMQAAIDDLCMSTDFDVIHVEFSTMCGFRFPDGIPMVLDEHNIEYEVYRRLYEGERSLLRRAFNGLEYLQVRRFEERSWNQAQACVVTSAREEPTVRAAVPSLPTAVVPNGVDLEYFAPWTAETQPHTVVFNGILNYRPNLDAATDLVEHVWPLVLGRCPSARLVIVGHAPEREARALRRPTVDVVGTVPDVRPYLGSAEVVAVPIRMGGGTRLKVVEALSMAKPMVSTSLGCEGLAVRDREHLLIADDIETFARQILELFDDADLRRRLGFAGRALAEQSYSWHLAGDRLEALYRRVMGEGSRRSVVDLEPVGV
jgi:glycosyltransferase involved in cell wall biosynthesis